MIVIPTLWTLSLSHTHTHTHTHTGTVIHGIHQSVSHIKMDAGGQARLWIHGWWTEHWVRRPETFISTQCTCDCDKSSTSLSFSCSSCKRIAAISVHFLRIGHSSSGVRSRARSPSSEENIRIPSMINNKNWTQRFCQETFVERPGEHTFSVMVPVLCTTLGFGNMKIFLSNRRSLAYNHSPLNIFKSLVQASFNFI